MNNLKSKSSENNENLCPLQRKRIKTTISAKSTPNQSAGKCEKFETASSPSSAISLEILEEMGISALDTGSSSESANSACGNDENSNEATPNLDAPKFKHNSGRLAAFHNEEADTSLSGMDSSTDNATNSFIEFDETIKTNTKSLTTHNIETDNNKTNNYNNNYYKWNIIKNNESHYYHNPNQQQQHHQASSPLKCNVKKTAILGIGAGNINITSPQKDQHQHGINKSINRSPLSVVACNSHHLNTNTYSSTSYLQTANAMSSSSSTAHSSAMPSTSKQAILNLQQQKLQEKHKQLLQEQQLQQLNKNRDTFFLYRRNETKEHMEQEVGIDHFKKFSDEVILQVFKWLPKKALLRCASVCHRFNRCASDESLWSRVDLGGRTLRIGAMEDIMKRGVVVCRLSMTELKHPVLEASFLENEVNFVSKLQFLDLSMVTITKPSLKMLLSRCRLLRKLSLEHVNLNDDVCTEIAYNTNLEALNLTMCSGIEPWSIRKMFSALSNLTSLNISWTNLSVDAIRSFVSNITPNILRLNIAGCRKTMFDTHLATLAERCPQLLELDVSDCISLTGNAIEIICRFKMLEYLSLSRCYLIPASTFMDLINLPTLTYLDVFGMLSDPTLETLQKGFPKIGINKFIHSSVARPTVGTRRTAIWGLRTRD